MNFGKGKGKERMLNITVASLSPQRWKTSWCPCILLRTKKGFPSSTSGKKTACQCRRLKRCVFSPWVGKIPWKRAWQSTLVLLPGESMDRGAWWATVHGVSKCWCNWPYWQGQRRSQNSSDKPFRILEATYITIDAFTLKQSETAFVWRGHCWETILYASFGFLHITKARCLLLFVQNDFLKDFCIANSVES